MGDFKVVRSLEDIAAKSTNAEVLDTAEGFFVGKEGFGTYSYLLHNLRLPTEARTRAFAIN
nr:MAG TPA: nucleoporin [Bacteriophage sp.]